MATKNNYRSDALLNHTELNQIKNRLSLLLKRLILGIGFFVFLFSQAAQSATYSLPPSGNNIIGDVEYKTSQSDETLGSIGLQFDVGHNAMKAANPQLDPEAILPGGTKVEIPSRFILPSTQRRGIVINLAEMRLYYFLPENGTVITHPVGIGQLGRTIPLAKTQVVRKVVDPVWIPTPAIRDYNEEKGVTLPAVMPPGPDNPLGPYAIYLGIPTYLIHSTIFPDSIGRRASFGCIRMKEEDIKDMFSAVTPGTPVTIIDSPFKTGWQGNKLYLESHEILEEQQSSTEDSLTLMVRTIENATKGRLALVDWQLAAYLAEEQPSGVPQEIGIEP